MINNFTFTPTTGLRDAGYSPTAPTNEAAIRDQVQGISDQLMTFINNIILSTLHSQTLGSSGSEEIASPTIAGLPGNNVYTQIANMLAVAQAAQAGTILPGIVTDTMLSNSPGMVKAQLADMAIQTNVTGTATAIIVNTSGGGFTYTQGRVLKFKASADNGAVATTINVDTQGAKNIKKLDGSNPTLKANKVYEIYYDIAGGCFFLVAKASGTAGVGDVLATKTFSNDSDTDQVGTMINKVGSATTIIPSGADQAIPQGYYGGSVGDGVVKAIALAVGENLWASADTADNVSYGPYTKIKEIQVQNVGGTVRVRFDIQGKSDGAYGRIYVNGVARGTERNNLTTSYVTYTEDISVNAGDLIQLYVKNVTGFVNYRNLRLYVSIPIATAVVNLN